MEFDFKKYNSIGILGGTFNPIHTGHLMMGSYALKEVKDIEHVIYLPNNKPAYKSNDSIVTPEHRIKMIDLALEDSRASSCDIEIKRGGLTYTIDTLRYIKSINNNLKIYFIIGEDSLMYFDKWFEFEEILKLCSLVVARRQTEDSFINSKIKYLNDRIKDAEIICMDSPEIEISSSKLREELGKRIYNDKYLPLKVIEYIKENNLYI